MMEDKTNSNLWILNDNLLRLESWARDGLTDKQIAKNMNVSIQMFHNLKNNNKEISNALNNVSDANISEVLNKSCELFLNNMNSVLNILGGHNE